MFKLALFTSLVAFSSGAYYEETLEEWMANINNDPDSHFKAGHNPYLTGKSLENIKTLMGAKMREPTDEEMMASIMEDEVDASKLPATFITGVTKWPECKSTVFSIKDQANCGSCWAVAASETIADRMCIANYANLTEEESKKAHPIDLSAAQILECCAYCGDGCSGGYPIDAMKYWYYTGVVSGAPWGSNCGCQPYNIEPCSEHRCNGEVGTPQCSKSCQSGFPSTFSSDKHYASTYYSIRGGYASMMSEIYARGSIECAFSVYENFMHYSGGVYSKISGQRMGGHAVKVIGWGWDGNLPYWLINNSWNTTWGINGQFKFLRGYDLAGMESGCVAGIAKPDSHFLLPCE